MAKINSFFTIILLLCAVLFGCSEDSTPVPVADLDQPEESLLGDLEDEPDGYVDPQAVEIVANAIDFLLAQESFSVIASAATDVVQDNGQKIQFSKTSHALLRRPDKLRIENRRDDGSRSFMWYDGNDLTVYDDMPQIYGQIAAPPNIDETIDFIENVLDGPQPLADLFHSDDKYLKREYYAAHYVGRSWLQDTETEHLAFQGEHVDWQIWVATGEQPLLHKIVITYKWLEGEPQYMARLYEWDLAPDNDDDKFDAVIPETAIKVDMLVLEPIDTSDREAS